MLAFSVDIGQVIDHLVHLGVAFVLALPLGWNREREERSAGLRTFPLVAVASCGFVLLAQLSYHADPGAEARVLQGVITGIGFIGGGAILKSGSKHVRGTATATCIWATGLVGAATAYRRYEVAIAVSAAAFATVRWLTPLKERARKAND